jgi:hypothetical protein
LEQFVASGGDGAKWLAAASGQPPSTYRPHGTATTHGKTVNARAAEALQRPLSPFGGGASGLGDRGFARQNAVAEATRALEYELRQLDADFAQV